MNSERFSLVWQFEFAEKENIGMEVPGWENVNVCGNVKVKVPVTSKLLLNDFGGENTNCGAFTEVTLTAWLSFMFGTPKLNSLSLLDEVIPKFPKSGQEPLCLDWAKENVDEFDLFATKEIFGSVCALVLFCPKQLKALVANWKWGVPSEVAATLLLLGVEKVKEGGLKLIFEVEFNLLNWDILLLEWVATGLNSKGTLGLFVTDCDELIQLTLEMVLANLYVVLGCLLQFMSLEPIDLNKNPQTKKTIAWGHLIPVCYQTELCTKDIMQSFPCSQIDLPI